MRYAATPPAAAGSSDGDGDDGDGLLRVGEQRQRR